jgi:hypothetical protein
MPEDEQAGILYHYTSFGNFKNIMQSGIIRATHYTELNDWTEVEFGLNKLETAFKEYTDTIPEASRKLIESVFHQLKSRTVPLYIFSLSEERNALDQWRAYAPEGGVAIGFKREALVHALCAKRFGVEEVPYEYYESNFLTPCRYLKEEDKANIQPVVDRAKDFDAEDLQALSTSDRGMKNLLKIFATMGNITGYCCAIKHHAYKNEKEWRIICSEKTTEPLYVQLNDNNRRYVEMSFDLEEGFKGTIEEVVVSSHGDTTQGESLAHFFHDSLGLDYDIQPSKIPFRG